MISRFRLFALLGVASAMTFSYSYGADATATMKDQTTTTASEHEELVKLSEAFGHFIGRNLQSTGIDFNIDALIKGIRDGASGKPAPMTDQEYEQKMVSVQEKAFKKLSEKNLNEAEEFLRKNAQSSGIKVIEPGKLQIMVLQQGNGAEVKTDSAPLINYTGKYLNGTVFGSSEDSGAPITIPLDQTIPGFSKALVGMKEGEKRRIFVHPELGYGTSGHLAPNSLLIFEVEVVKAESPDKAKKDAASLDDDDDSDDDENDNDDDDDDNDDDDSTPNPKTIR